MNFSLQKIVSIKKVSGSPFVVLGFNTVYVFATILHVDQNTGNQTADFKSEMLNFHTTLSAESVNTGAPF